MAPEKRAKEVKIGEVSEDKWNRGTKAEPMRPAYSCAAMWTLSVGGGSGGHGEATIDWTKRLAKLFAPKSELGKQAKGVSAVETRHARESLRRRRNCGENLADPLDSEMSQAIQPGDRER